MKLDELCSRYFTYQMLIECGETFHASTLDNLPKDPLSWQALAALAQHILDPVVDQFGRPELTFGFCSQALAKARRRYARTHGLLPSIFPSADQHAGRELDANGKRICGRGGAAVDFRVPGCSSREVAIWIIGNLPFDRVYYYGAERPLHVSYSEQPCRDVTVMRPKAKGRGFVPATLSATRFLERYGHGS